MSTSSKTYGRQSEFQHLKEQDDSGRPNPEERKYHEAPVTDNSFYPTPLPYGQAVMIGEVVEEEKDEIEV